ncbi:helix-turn-helix domain-containing protein [Streptomyces barkulensis]|uniref:helix-turn-helix domain-containing protein n=1 Tax=Streptomyces barkulensis TaxID=1257026 RepID=UPI001F0E1FED|nr:helix-turn-helix domain-containing protein [Streptomyces barkulensis]
MVESPPTRETDLLEQGVQALHALLGPGWQVTQRPNKSKVFDAVLEVRAEGDSTFTQLLVEATPAAPPRFVVERLVPRVQLLREVNHYTNLLVIAPWISSQARELLRRNGIAYLDLTGNIDIRVARPAIVIRTVGAEKAPRSAPRETSRTTLAGLKAGRLVRLLADVPPPHRATDLHRISKLSLPYVSRLLNTLEDQLLIRRKGRIITDVDWAQLLRARARETSLLAHGSYQGFLAPNGVPALLQQISQLPTECVDGLSVTGSYTVQRFVQVAVGGQLMLYVGPWLNIDDVADELGLLPVAEGADVLLLNEPDPFVRRQSDFVDGVQYVAPSQAALDCLAGPGRMPAEGEALLDFMETYPEQWRDSGNDVGVPPIQH